jgi:hypothetical protein
MGVEMSYTRNLQSSLLFALPFIGYQPGDISHGQPAVDAANLIKQEMVGPPFKWPWNRSVISFPVTSDSQDYEVAAPDFGFMEQAWLTDSKNGVKEIRVLKSLAAESSKQRPQSIAAQQFDTDGNVIFRLNTIPDQDYQIEIFYQRAAVLMSSPASLWSPIPDELSYVFDWGFLGMMSMLTKDARFPLYMTKFTAHLLGQQSGLTALERNIYLGNFLTLMNETQRSTLETQQGVQAKQQ